MKILLVSRLQKQLPWYEFLLAGLAQEPGLFLFIGKAPVSSKSCGQLLLEAEAGHANLTQTLSPALASDPTLLPEDCWSPAHMEREGSQERKEVRTLELQPLLLF